MGSLIPLIVIVVADYVVALISDYRVAKKEKEDLERCKKVDKYCDEEDN